VSRFLSSSCPWRSRSCCSRSVNCCSLRFITCSCCTAWSRIVSSTSYLADGVTRRLGLERLHTKCGRRRSWKRSPQAHSDWEDIKRRVAPRVVQQLSQLVVAARLLRQLLLVKVLELLGSLGFVDTECVRVRRRFIDERMPTRRDGAARTCMWPRSSSCERLFASTAVSSLTRSSWSLAAALSALSCCTCAPSSATLPPPPAVFR
jgi:hypothetical protein